MKKLFISMLSVLTILLASNTTKAQISFSLHIGTPPVWAPPAYAHKVRYYYIPEIDCYYDAVRMGYYYNDGPSWVFSASLPGVYASYDVARLHHVVVNYYGTRPYTYFAPRRTVYVQRYHPVQYRHEEYRRNDDDRGHWDNGNHGGRGPEWHGEGHGKDNHGHGDHGHH